jgi:hypothetical protein
MSEWSHTRCAPILAAALGKLGRFARSLARSSEMPSTSAIEWSPIGASGREGVALSSFRRFASAIVISPLAAATASGQDIGTRCLIESDETGRVG